MLIKQWLLSAHADHEDDDTTEGVDDLASQLEELCSHYAAEYGLRIYYEDHMAAEKARIAAQRAA